MEFVVGESYDVGRLPKKALKEMLSCLAKYCYKTSIWLFSRVNYIVCIKSQNKKVVQIY